MLRNGAASLHGSTNVQKVCRIHEGRGHLSRRQLTSRAFNARVHSSLYIKHGAGLGAFVEVGTGPGPRDQARATQSRDPLRPAKGPSRATQDHVGRPKSRQERPRGRKVGSKRAPGGARRPPGPPKNHEKRCTVDEIRLFGRTRLSSRPEGPKSRPGGAKSASGAAQSSQELPRAAQGPPRRAQGRPGTGARMTLEAR